MPPHPHLSPETLPGVREEFRKELKNQLFQEFFISKPPEESLVVVKESLSPRKDFSVELRSRLLETEISISKTTPFTRFQRRFAIRNSSATSFIRGFASLTVALALFASTFFFGLSGTSQASSESSVSFFTGTVKINRGYGEDIIVAGTTAPLFPGTTLSTEAGSFAVLEFFEDSVLRMDENTTVVVTQLDENPLRNDIGNVEIELLSGRVWSKTFATDEQYSRFLLKTSENIIPLAGSAIDVERKGYKTIVRAWSRSARIITEKSAKVLAEGKEAGILLGNISDAAPLLEEESSTEWVTRNRTEDKRLMSVFAEQKLEKRREEIEKEQEEIRKRFFLFSPKESSEDLLQLESTFFEGLTKVSAENTESKEAMEPFFTMAQEVWKKHPEETDALLISLEKTLQPVLPSSSLFVAKETIDTLRTSFSERPEVVQETRRTRQLWEAKTLADTGNVALAEAILEEVSGTDLVGIGTTSPEIATEILDQRQEQMVAVGAMEETSIAKDLLDETEENIVEKTTELVRPRFPSGNKISEADQARDIVLRMKKYSSNRGQENTLRAQLQNIEDKPENIGLLRELRSRVPNTFQNEVDEKIVSVLGGTHNGEAESDNAEEDYESVRTQVPVSTP